MRAHSYWVYILASAPCGWLYVGMTNDLVRRVEEHRCGQVDGYTREKGIDGLVWYEPHQYVDQAILREKRIKRWRRAGSSRWWRRGILSGKIFTLPWWVIARPVPDSRWGGFRDDKGVAWRRRCLQDVWDCHPALHNPCSLP